MVYMRRRDAAMARSLTVVVMFLVAIGVTGCDEGPFGNTPPQGRPDWMKDRKPANASPDNPDRAE